MIFSRSCILSSEDGSFSLSQFSWWWQIKRNQSRLLFSVALTQVRRRWCWRATRSGMGQERSPGPPLPPCSTACWLRLRGRRRTGSRRHLGCSARMRVGLFLWRRSSLLFPMCALKWLDLQNIIRLGISLYILGGRGDCCCDGQEWGWICQLHWI